MHVVFLDIDGVLNSGPFLQRDRLDRLPRWPDEHLDPCKIAKLNQILAATNAVCVLSSTWRILLPPERLQQLLEALGFQGRIIDQTGSCRGYRGKEIQQWLDQHPDVDRFVVLDDDRAYMEPVHEHLVQTTWAKGLEDVHVEHTIQRLNGTTAPMPLTERQSYTPPTNTMWARARKIGERVRLELGQCDDE